MRISHGIQRLQRGFAAAGRQRLIVFVAIVAFVGLGFWAYLSLTTKPVLTVLGESSQISALETPKFKLANVAKAQTKEATLIRNGQVISVQPEITERSDGSVEVSVPPITSFTPGKYLLSVQYDRGRGIETITQEFDWGVLAFNVYKSPHIVGDQVTMGIAVLDDLGITLCDAGVVLEVQKPNGTIVTPEIKKSEICADKYVTDIPDYTAQINAEEAGTYNVQLTAQTKNGERSLRDSFEVMASASTQITRATSMRIYPVAEYNVALSVTSERGGKQTLRELVPNKFTITPAQKGVVKQLDDQLQEITWELDLTQGEQKTVSYSYNAPDITPQFYLLGPAKLGDFSEKRAWQIASDEVGSASSNRLWSSGAELNSLTAGMEIDGSSGTTPTINGTTKRSGDFAYRTNTSSNTATIYKDFAGSAQSDSFWFRAYVRIATAPGVEMGILRIGTTTNNKIGVRMNTDRSIELWNEEDSAQIGSASSALALNTWYRVEVFIDSTTLSSTDATLKLDGVDVASSTAENLAAGVDRLTWGNLTSTTSDLYFDDIAINGDTGRNDNWPGEGKIVHMHGNADGDNEAWTASPNNTDDYDDLNEVTPTDGSSGGGVHTITNNAITEINLETATSAGITSGDSIKLVAMGARMAVCGNGQAGWGDLPPDCLPNSVLINYKQRIKATSGGTVEETANIPIPDDYGDETFFTNDDGTRLPKLTLYDLPGASAAKWTTADLDTTQIGISNHDTTVGFKSAAIWLLVEYNPASGGRLYSSGFELNSTTADMEWTSFTGAGQVQSSVVRTGTYAMRSNPNDGTGTGGYATQVFSASETNQSMYLRAYVYVQDTSAEVGDYSIIDFRDATTRRAYITISNSRTLKLFDEDGQIGSASSALSAATWYRIELRLDSSGSGGSHIVDARIDGSSFASSTSRNISTGTSRFRVGFKVNGETGTPDAGGTIVIDDVALNQATGTVQNSWPGEGKIIHLSPNAAGDNSAWTNSYTNIDDTTPPNDATDVISETTTNDIFDSNLSDSSLTAETVNLVTVGARFRTNTATEEQFRLRLKDAANGNTIESPILAPASTTWRTHTTASPFLPTLTAYTRPEQDTAWTDTQLDVAQIGVKDMGGSGTIEVSSMWLLVEYQPIVPITVSGTIYSDEGITPYNCSADNLTIGVSVNGGATNAGTCTSAGGTYSITVAANPTAAGEPLSIWIDSSETPQATTVTRVLNTTSNVTQGHLFVGRVIVKHEDAGPITNANLSTADNGNAGIRYNVSSGNVTLDSGVSLYIWGSTNFTPGGNVTTNTTGGDVKINSGGVFTAGSNTITVGGSWNNTGTFTAGTSTVTFSSVATGRTLAGTLTGSTGKFYNLVFNGVGGGWTFSAAVALDNDFTITNGAVTASNNNLTVGRDFILANTTGVNYTAGTSTVSFTRDFTDTGDKFTAGTTSTVTHTGTGTFTAADASTFQNLNFGATGFTTTRSNNSMIVTGVLTVNGGTVTGSGGSTTLQCSVTCTPFAFASATTLNGTEFLFFNGNAASITVNMAGGNYGNWRLHAQSSTGNNIAFVTTGNITTTGELRFEAENGLTGSSFSTTGSNHNLTLAALMIAPCSPTRNGSWTVSLNDSVVTLSNTTNSLYGGSNCGSHTLNLNTSDITVSGAVSFVNGTTAITVNPGTSDFRFAPANATSKTYTPNGQSLYNVFIQAGGSSGTVLLGGAMDVNNDLTITTGVLDVANTLNYDVFIGGSYSNAGTFETRLGTVTFDATTTGKTLSGNMDYGNGDFLSITFNGVGGEWSINSTLSVSSAFTVTAGTVIGASNVNVYGNCTGNGTIAMTGGTFNVAGGGPRNFGSTSGSNPWTFNNLTLQAGGGFAAPFTVGAGTGTVTVNGLFRLGVSGNTQVTTLVAGNRTWVIAGTNGDPFQMLASPAAVITPQTSTFRYTGNNGAGNTTIQAATYNNFEVDNASETYVYEGAMSVANDFTVTNGAVTASNFNLTVGRDFILADTAGVAYTAGSSTITVARNFTDTNATGKFAYGTSTVVMSGTGTLATNQLFNVSAAFPTFTTTLSTTLVTAIFGTLTVNGGTLTSSSGYTNLQRTTSGVSLVVAAKTTFSGTRLLVHRVNGGTNVVMGIVGLDYGGWSLTTYVSGTNNTTYNFLGAVTTTGDITHSINTGITGTTYNTNNFDITASRYIIADGAAGRAGLGTHNFGSSVINLTGTNDALYPASANNASGHVLNLQSSRLIIRGNLLLTNGTGAITINPGTSTVVFAPPTATTKTFFPNAQVLNNMVIDGAGTLQLEGAIDINGDLSINAGTLNTKSGSNFAISIAGNFTKGGGTFTGNNSTLTFYEKGRTSTIRGTFTVYNLVSTESNKFLAFEAGQTVTVTNNLTLTGEPGDPIYVNSTVPGSQWFIRHNGGTESVSHIEIKDSGCHVSSQQISITSGTGQNLGNNGSCWEFTFLMFGTVYDTDAVTPITTSPSIGYALNGTYLGSVAADGSGNFTIDGLPLTSGGASLVVFLNTNGGIRGETYTRVDSDALTINVYRNRTTVQCDQAPGCELTFNDIQTYSSVDDADILISHFGSYVEVPAASTLSVRGGFLTDGSVDGIDIQGDVEILATGVYNSQAFSTNIGGSYSNAGKFIDSGNQISFSSTTPGKTLSGNLSGEYGKMLNIGFYGVGGGWTYSNAAEVGSLLIQDGTLTAPSTTLTITSSLNRASGTFTHNSGKVIFSGDSGGAIYGTFTGSSAFHKIEVESAGVSVDTEWVFYSAIDVSAINATDTFVIKGGTVALGADFVNATHTIRGRLAVGTGNGETAVLALIGRDQGETNTLDLNANTSTPNCPNCTVEIGRADGASTAEVAIGTNAILRLNPRSSATASDTGVNVYASGKLSLLGSVETINPVTATDTLAQRETKMCTLSDFTANDHTGKVARITTGLATGRLYDISATTVNDTDCATNSHDSITRATTASATEVSPTVSGSGSTRVLTLTTQSGIITTSGDQVGRYVHNLIDDTYFRIIQSANVGIGTDTITIIAEPDSLAGMATNEDIEITDGVRAGDGFEIIDYAHITAEAGTACNATVGQAGEAFIYAQTGSEVVMNGAEVCNMGRNASGKRGFSIDGVDGSQTNQGFTISKSRLKNNYSNIEVSNSSNNAAGKGILASYFSGETTGSSFASTTNANTITTSYFASPAAMSIDGANNILSNSVFANVGLILTGTFTLNQVSSNTFFCNTIGTVVDFSAGSTTFSNNTVMGCVTGVQVSGGADGSNLTGNTFYGSSTALYIEGVNNISASANTLFANTTAMSILGSNEVSLRSNVIHSNTTGVAYDFVPQLVMSQNSIYGNVQGVSLDDYGYGIGGTLISIRDSLGTPTANSASDISAQYGTLTLKAYGTTLASSTPFSNFGPGTGNSALILQRDGNTTLNQIYGDYAYGGDDPTTTSINESVLKLNVADPIWPDQTFPAYQSVLGGTADAPTTGFAAASAGSVGGYTYTIVCAEVSCSTTTPSWNVYRNGTLLTAKATTLQQYTDTQTDGGFIPNITFTIPATTSGSYGKGSTIVFSALKSSGDTGTNKALTVMTSGSTVTIAGSLEINGVSAGSSLGPDTPTTAYNLINNGSITGDTATITVSGSFTGNGMMNLGTNGNIVMRSASNTSYLFGQTAGSLPWNLGTLTFRNASASGASTYTFSTGSTAEITVQNLTIGDVADTQTANVTNATNNRLITVNGNAVITTNGAFTASASTPLRVNGNWTRSGTGTFSSNSGTVVFTGSGTSTLSGSTTFANLTISNPSSKTVNFPTSDIIAVTGLFSAQAGLGQPHTLQSTTGGVQWNFLPTGTYSIDNVRIQDGGCEGGAITMTVSNSTNLGNNDSCWVFNDTTGEANRANSGTIRGTGGTIRVR